MSRQKLSPSVMATREAKRSLHWCRNLGAVRTNPSRSWAERFAARQERAAR